MALLKTLVLVGRGLYTLFLIKDAFLKGLQVQAVCKWLKIKDGNCDAVRIRHRQDPERRSVCFGEEAAGDGRTEFMARINIEGNLNQDAVNSQVICGVWDERPQGHGVVQRLALWLDENRNWRIVAKVPPKPKEKAGVK